VTVDDSRTDDSRTDDSTVAGMLLARSGDDAPGLRYLERTWTWDECVAESAVRSAWLGALRRPGPFHIGVLLDNVPEFSFWLGAAALCGATVVGINPTRRGAELTGDIAHTECQVVVTDMAGRELLSTADHGVRTLVLDTPEYAAGLAAHSGAAPPSSLPGSLPAPGDLYLLLFTSGTTGTPKAVRCTQGRLAGIAARVNELFGVCRADTCYCVMPMFHGNALMALWAPAMRVGACIALSGRFSASRFLSDVRRYRATYSTYVGKALTYVLATPARPDDADNPLERMFGNEASDRDIEEFERRFGAKLIEGYGMSEGGATINRVPGMPRGALGVGPPGVVVMNASTRKECPRARFDAAGRLLNADEAIGEIVNTEGLAGFEGYWRNEEAEAERSRGGWYWTGDLGYHDEDGYFWFAGRSSDWLRVDGENFAAAPVERILMRHPDLLLAAVYAVPDTAAGDQVMAAVELRPEAGSREAWDGACLGEFLGAQADLGTKWAPRYVRLVEALPATASNKTVRRGLQAEGFLVSDPVWWRPGRDLTYRRLGEEDRAAIRAEFEAHGRGGLLGG